MGPAIDGIKFVGGSPHVMTRSSVVELIEISHARFVYVCESGLLQHALAQVRVDIYIILELTVIENSPQTETPKLAAIGPC